MSRSYKKHPIWKLKNSRWGKIYSNRVVRRYKELTKGKMYKKIFNSWDICDYKSIPSEEEKKNLTYKDKIK